MGGSQEGTNENRRHKYGTAAREEGARLVGYGGMDKGLAAETVRSRIENKRRLTQFHRAREPFDLADGVGKDLSARFEPSVRRRPSRDMIPTPSRSWQLQIRRLPGAMPTSCTANPAKVCEQPWDANFPGVGGDKKPMIS